MGTSIMPQDSPRARRARRRPARGMHNETRIRETNWQTPSLPAYKKRTGRRLRCPQREPGVLSVLMSARSAPATPLATPREVGPPSRSPAPMRPLELQVPSPLSVSMTPRHTRQPRTAMVDQNASCAKEQAKRHNQPKSDVHGSLAPREEVEEARWVVAAVAVVAAPSVEEKREDAAKVIQKHIRGALARMASKQWTGKRRTVTLLKRLSEAAQRLEAVECSFTEAELRQLSADVTTLVALLKEMPELGDLIRERGGTDAMDVFCKAKRRLAQSSHRTSQGQEAVASAVTEASRRELENFSCTELVQRATELGADPAAIAAAMIVGDGKQAAQLVEVVISAIEAAAGRSCMQGKCSNNLSNQIRELLAVNIQAGALDTLLIVDPQRLSAAMQRDDDSAASLKERDAQLRAEAEGRAKEVHKHNAATLIQRHARGRKARKELKAKQRLRLDCANVVLRHAARLKQRAMRKRQEKRLFTWAATKIQAQHRGFETRKLLHRLQSEGVEVWVASGHTRAAQRWFEKFSGEKVQHCGWLRRDQLHRLVIELRSTHGLPVIDHVVEREVREMMDGSFDRAFREARAHSPRRQATLKLYHDKLSFPRWLQIIRAAEQRVVPHCAPRTAQPDIPPPGWAHSPRWTTVYPQIWGGDSVFPKIDRDGRHRNNKFYPVGVGVSGCDAPCISPVHAPPVMRKPLADALWTWCGESSHFVHNNAV